MNGMRIGRLFGIDVIVHPTWFLVLAFFAFTLATGFFPASYAGWSTVATWTTAIVAALLLFVTVLAHEFGHSLVARSQGIPVRGITLFALGGVSQLSREPDSPGREAWMAIAGPLVSVVVAAISLGLAFVLPGPSQVVAVLAYLGVANIALVAFNLLPGFPLDGGRVLRALLWWRSGDLVRATRQAAVVGQVFAWGFIALGAAQLVLAGGLGGLFLVFVGWLLIQAARSTARQTMLDHELSGVPARRIMTTPAGWLSPYVTLDWAMQGRLNDYASRCLPVAAEDPAAEYGGLMCAHDLRRSARERYDRDRVRDVMTAAPDVPAVSPDTEATEVLRLLRDGGADRAVVVDAAGRLLGFIDAEAFARFLSAGRLGGPGRLSRPTAA
jgi:Zn-dependent protease/CBS domain-containing protein